MKIIILSYGVFILYEWNVGKQGGRGTGSEWLRDWVVWKIFCDYFPIKLVKTTELSADRNYVFAAYPHGLIG